MKAIASAFLLTALITAIFFFVTYTDPPRGWWGPEVTISQVEDRHKKQIELSIAHHREGRVRRYNSKTDSFRDETKKEVNDSIKQLLTEKKINYPQWIQLKSLYKNGDIIRSYSAPPLSGTFGYILVRNNKVIFKYEKGIQ